MSERDRQARREKVRELTEQGMSLSAIAEELGVDRSTISRDRSRRRNGGRGGSPNTSSADFLTPRAASRRAASQRFRTAHV